MKTLVLVFFTLGLAACAAVPNGGYHGDLAKFGTPGEVLDRVIVGKGLFVATAHLDKNRSVNLQITREDEPSYAGTKDHPILYNRTLTIGKFSKILGSGFSSAEDIYYRKRIWYDGKDVFRIGDDWYLVEWEYRYRDPVSYIITDMFTISFRAFRKRT